MPLIVTACVVAAVFPNSIVRHPLAWSMCAFGVAVSLSVLVLYCVTGSWVGVTSIVLATPAAAIFYVIARVWLRPTLAAW
jgi:hypothetical protein